MGVKLLLALLTVMLVILLVFNAFNIAYAPNDFMGTMITVENGLGQVSDFALKAFDKVKEFVLLGIDLFDLIYEKTIGKFVAWFEDTFDFSLVDWFVDSLRKIVNTFKEISLLFDYVSSYGLHPTRDYWRDEFTLFVSCLHSSEFYEDYKDRFNFDWYKFEKYRDAYLYGADNEYSYLITLHLQKNFTSFVPDVAQNTLIFDYSILQDRKLKFADCDFWLTTIDLSLPDEYCPFLEYGDRFDRYFSGIVPVYDSNFYYTYHDYECDLTGIRIRDDKQGNENGVTPDRFFQGEHPYFFKIDNKFVLLELIFTYIGPGGKSYDISVLYGDYMEYQATAVPRPNLVNVLDYIPT